MKKDRRLIYQNTTFDNNSTTIVMPVLNEGEYLVQTLNAVIQNGFPLEDMCIFIVDGGSKDNSVEIIQSYVVKWPNLFKLVEQKGATVYQALALALASTDAEYFIRVDARSIIPPGYIKKCLNNLNKEGVLGTGGVQEQYATSIFGQSVAVATTHFFGVGNASFRLGKKSGYVDTVYLGAYRTVDLKKVGGFDSKGRFLSEDSAINARLRAVGGRIYLSAEMRVKYPAKESPCTLARQYLIYGAGKATYFLSHGRLTSWRQTVPLLFLISLIFSLFLAIYFDLAKVIFFILLLGYFIVNICISAWLANCNRGKASFKKLIMIFTLIHFSWPIGFLIRLLGGEMLLSKILQK